MNRGNICCDGPRKRRPLANVAHVHFRPALPYPLKVLGPGGEPYGPVMTLGRRQVFPPTQAGRFTCKGPSCTGPFTYFVSWDPWIGDENFGSGAFKGGSSGV
jgi:hypothetical protein